MTEEVNRGRVRSCVSAWSKKKTPTSLKLHCNAANRRDRLCAQLVRGQRAHYSHQRSSPGRSWGSAWCPSPPALLTHTPRGWRWSWRCSASWWGWWRLCTGSLQGNTAGQCWNRETNASMLIRVNAGYLTGSTSLWNYRFGVNTLQQRGNRITDQIVQQQRHETTTCAHFTLYTHCTCLQSFIWIRGLAGLCATIKMNNTLCFKSLIKLHIYPHGLFILIAQPAIDPHSASSIQLTLTK